MTRFKVADGDPYCAETRAQLSACLRDVRSGSAAAWAHFVEPDAGEILALGEDSRESGMLAAAREYLARYGVDMTATAIYLPGWILADHKRRAVEFVEVLTRPDGLVSVGVRKIQLEGAPMPLPKRPAGSERS